MDLPLKEKIERLEKLIEMDPEDATGLFMLGKLYIDDQNYQKAAEALEKCISVKPDYSAAWKLCGDSYRKVDNMDKAKEIYQQGIEVADERGDLQTVREMKALLKAIS